jgi:uncharacterized protein (AIM24 family)
MSGESLFITHFTNEGQRKARVAFAAPYPGNIIPLNLANLPGNAVICQRDAFLCAALGTKLSMTFNKRIGSGLFGGACAGVRGSVTHPETVRRWSRLSHDVVLCGRRFVRV